MRKGAGSVGCSFLAGSVCVALASCGSSDQGKSSPSSNEGGVGGMAGQGAGASGQDEVAVESPQGVEYYIDRTEVTRQAYGAWLATVPSTTGQPEACAQNNDFTPTCKWPPTDPLLPHPVVCVDWCDAYAYCKAAGKRLCGRIGGGANAYQTYRDPNIDQWYNACAAGKQGDNCKTSSDGSDCDYPYGSGFRPHACNAGLHGRRTTMPAASLPDCRTQSGIVDMSGNVREWKDACELDPQSTVFNYCRLGGGSFRDGELRHLSCNSPGQDAARTGHWDSIGFRCCRDGNTPTPVGAAGSGAGGAGQDACNECLSQSCPTQDTQCMANNDCVLMVDCGLKCFNAECVSKCETEHPNGVTAYQAWLGCYKQNCANACGM